MSPIRILHLEDEPGDTELVGALLKAKGMDAIVERVDEKDSFLKSLDTLRPDLILSDFSLPNFTGIEALEFARESMPHVPFIFLSGKIGEELAVETLRQGAMDYVMKNSMAKLPSVLSRALQEARIRSEKARGEAELRASEARLATLLENSSDAIWSIDSDYRITAFNQAAARSIRGSGGKTPKLGAPIGEIFPQDLRLQWEAWFGQAMRGEVFRVEQAISESGKELHFEICFNPIRTGDASAGVVVHSRDITERKAQEREIIRQRDELAKANERLMAFKPGPGKEGSA